MLFSLKTHREFFGSVRHGEEGGDTWLIGLALATLAGVTVPVGLVSEIFVESVQEAAMAFGMTPAFVGPSLWRSWVRQQRWPRHFAAHARTGWT
jgi:Ca2+:H+ antiporter